MVESIATVPEVTINLTKLVVKCNQSLAGNKYALFFDSTGSREVFFRYKARLLEINKLSLGVVLGKHTKADAIE